MYEAKIAAGPEVVEVSVLYVDLPPSHNSCTQVWLNRSILREYRFKVLGKRFGAQRKRWRVDSAAPLDPLPSGLSSRSLIQLRLAISTELERTLILPVPPWSHELIDLGRVE